MLRLKYNFLTAFLYLYRSFSQRNYYCFKKAVKFIFDLAI